MPFSIVLTGTYSAANKGDAGMQLSFAQALRERWPEAKVVISAPFARADAPLYAGLATVVQCQRRRLVVAAFQVVRAALWRLLKRAMGVDARWLIPEPELQAYRDASLVVDLSGDMLTDDYGPHVALSHYMPLLNALLLGKPLFICAQSVGPFGPTRLLARWIFGRAQAVTLRDPISFAHVESLGLRSRPATATADMAFLLRPASAGRAIEILAAEGIEWDKRPVLCVSVSPILEKRYEAESRDRFVAMMASVLDAFLRAHEARVLLVPHVTGPKAAGDDRRVASRVAGEMRARADVILGDYRPDELKAVIGLADMVLGARMHANIAALSQGIPVVALSYSHKTPGIMAMLGQRERALDGSRLEAERLLETLTATWEQRREVRSHIESRLAQVRRSAANNIDIAALILQLPGRARSSDAA